MSFSLVLAIPSSCARVILPTLSVCGFGEPLSSLMAFLISVVAGGVLMMKVKLLSANAVITTGSIRPGSTFWVWALNALQNSMMFRPRWPSAGPMGGDGFALPAGTWSLMKPTTFFATCLLLSGSSERRECDALPVQSTGNAGPVTSYLGFLDLPEVQFHRRRAAEDQHRDADLALLVVHLFDRSVEVRERALGDAHGFSGLEEHLRLRFLHAFLHLVQDVRDFLVRDGRGPHRRAAYESGDLGRALHQVPRLVRHVHLHEDVTGEKAPLADRLLAALHLHDLL